MRRRLVQRVIALTWWPLELACDLGYEPTLPVVHAQLAAVETVRFFLDALLWINRDGVSGS
jgi:hypothetical protein